MERENPTQSSIASKALWCAIGASIGVAAMFALRPVLFGDAAPAQNQPAPAPNQAAPDPDAKAFYDSLPPVAVPDLPPITIMLEDLRQVNVRDRSDRVASDSSNNCKTGSRHIQGGRGLDPRAPARAKALHEEDRRLSRSSGADRSSIYLLTLCQQADGRLWTSHHHNSFGSFGTAISDSDTGSRGCGRYCGSNSPSASRNFARHTRNSATISSN